MTIACIDVDYRDDHAVAACIVIDSWDTDISTAEYTVRVDKIEPYESGKFYKRELPCVQAILAEVKEKVDIIVIDGHVWLEENEKGLGALLFDTLAVPVTVVGIAKSAYRPNPAVVQVLRGTSKAALHVSEIGPVVDAPARVLEMHGNNRIPTILKRVDQLCRTT